MSTTTAAIVIAVLVTIVELKRIADALDRLARHHNVIARAAEAEALAHVRELNALDRMPNR